MSAGAITGKVPLVGWWLASLVLVAMMMLIAHIYAEREHDERVEYETALEWQATTYVATGEFESLTSVQEILPYSWQASANYRITTPADAVVQPGEQVLVESKGGRTGKKPPTEADQQQTLQLRVTDDEDHRVVQAGKELRAPEDETRVEKTQLDSAVDQRSIVRATTRGMAVFVLGGLTVLTFLRPGRARRFAGSRIPAELTMPDGPYSEQRWQRRNQILPALEKDAISVGFPLGLIAATVVFFVPAVAARRGDIAALVLAAVALTSIALWIRERSVARLRNAWATLGHESRMGPAPDTEKRLRARNGAILLRLSAVVGLVLGLLLLLVGWSGLAMMSDTNGTDRWVGMLAGGAVIVVTAGFCFAGGLAQRQDSAAERRGAQLR